MNKGAKAGRPRRPVTYAVDCHPLLREHFAAELREQHPDGRREGHQRLYEYLCATTPDKDQPTLEDLQPLYQAVSHGCQAGLQQEAFSVLDNRIGRFNEKYPTKKLGAFSTDLGGVACFFEEPWKRVSPNLSEAHAAWLLNQAAFRLRALGRLTEALELMRVSGKMDVKVKEWDGAARSYSNLSELELALREVAGAVGDAEQSVTYADRSGEWGKRMSKRTTHADALHQAGHRAEAEARFREAEALQAESQPDYPLLYSLWGFRYCDLLLTGAERAAWQRTLECGDLSPLSHVAERHSVAVSPLFGTNSRPQVELHAANESGSAANQSGDPSAPGPHSKGLRDVEQRAAQTLQWVEAARQDILSAALDHLILGRAAFYAAILGRAELPLGPRGIGFQPVGQLPGDNGRLEAYPTVELATARRELDAAVAGLRRAGTMHHIPRGLLTRAWLRCVAGQRTGVESAQSDLDEAWEVAERGAMKLFLADIYLHRARLFGRPAVGERGSVLRPATAQAYPWNSPAADLAAAETLINACGYHRRDEELADAKAAFGIA